MDFGLDIKKYLSSEPSEINLQVSYSISDNSAFIFRWWGQLWVRFGQVLRLVWFGWCYVMWYYSYCSCTSWSHQMQVWWTYKEWGGYVYFRKDIQFLESKFLNLSIMSKWDILEDIFSPYYYQFWGILTPCWLCTTSLLFGTREHMLQFQLVPLFSHCYLVINRVNNRIRKLQCYHCH